MLPNLDPTSPLMIEARKKEKQALDLKAAGVSFVQIAEVVGYADHSGARKAVLRALKNETALPIEQLREVEIKRLEDMYRHVIGILTREGQDEKTKLEAVRTLLRVDESFRKLLGLDAPQAVELTGPDGGAIPIEVRAAQLQEKVKEYQAQAALKALPEASEG